MAPIVSQVSGGSRISPRRGCQLPRGGGAPTYDFAKFPQKLHEIERIWAPGGGTRPKFYCVDPPLQVVLVLVKIVSGGSRISQTAGGGRGVLDLLFGRTA